MRQHDAKVDFTRHARQILLVEIGAAGQARIGAATAAVRSPGLAGEVAALYAERAGFGAVVAAPEPAPGAAPADGVVTPAARAVLSGVRAAQRALLAALAEASEEIP